ncbi:MAG: HisA/HisF-related TIM barrel protein, partial [Armatimonadota bacterium]
MDIIPAIDLSEGQCVRLKRGDIEQKTVYSDNPAEFAKKWQGLGATVLHVVDLDGAMSGRSQ